MLAVYYPNEVIVLKSHARKWFVREKSVELIEGWSHDGCLVSGAQAATLTANGFGFRHSPINRSHSTFVFSKFASLMCP